MLKRLDLRPRAYAAGLHLLISAAVAGLAAVLVFFVWYPGAFRHMAGGRDLFLLVTAVDVVIGPVLTFAVFNRAKGKRHLSRDLAVIALLQIAALVYGLHTVYIARPVAMVFEVERFRLVSANDVLVEELPKALPEFRELSLTGPQADRRPPARNGRRAQRRDVHGRHRHRRRPAADLLAALRPDPGAGARALQAGGGAAQAIPGHVRTTPAAA